MRCHVFVNRHVGVGGSLDLFCHVFFNRHVGVGGSPDFCPVFCNRHVGVGRSRPFATFSLTDTWVWDGLVFDAFSNRHVGL